MIREKGSHGRGGGRCARAGPRGVCSRTGGELRATSEDGRRDFRRCVGCEGSRRGFRLCSRQRRRPPPRALQQPKGVRPPVASCIGVTMPTSSSQRWIQDGDNVKKQLEAAGYKVDLQYAENDIPTQVNQVDNQITNGAKVLIIAVHRRHRADQSTAERCRQRHQGHLLRPADPQQPECRLLRHLRQRAGRCGPGQLRCWSGSGC